MDEFGLLLVISFMSLCCLDDLRWSVEKKVGISNLSLE